MSEAEAIRELAAVVRHIARLAVLFDAEMHAKLNTIQLAMARVTRELELATTDRGRHDPRP